MPLHLLGKKSWNVYNADNIAKVKRDEAAATAREEAEEQRMQEIDAERRIAILRGVTPPPLPEAPEPERGEKRRRDDGAGGVNKKRRIRGEDDTDRDIRLAKEEQEACSAARGRLAEAIEKKSSRTSDAPLVDRTGHVNLFPVDEHAIRKAHKNDEAEREKAKKKKELEDQYTMRFSNAAGFKQGLEKPWYAAQTKDFARENDAAREMLDEVLGKDVWGNEDPRRKEREMSRLVGNDPMAVMRQAQKQLKDVERERAKWKAERDEEMRQLDRRESRRSRRRPEDDQIDEFTLDAPAVDERETRRTSIGMNQRLADDSEAPPSRGAAVSSIRKFFRRRTAARDDYHPKWVSHEANVLTLHGILEVNDLCDYMTWTNGT
ncbi:hypothetical protein LTR16_001782 [Cryomyces antarcticus]|uniref:CBF1-interacting co-repressor CIR N-terminal domain-containing protein n=1 Tax=Cryomyces antarcticus TaxID=329879 RepID=A0ABR0LZ25_9PEZI|nr:hypothetical protein LTR16_001782 [Cryomyces antarcticus]